MSEASRVLEADAIGVGRFAHMHVRGRDMTFKAHAPGGKSETLLVVPNYNFDWQMAYRWEFGKQRFAKGTRLECVAHYDNSAFNPYNPDPKATVRDGLQTRHEMMNGFFFYVRADEDLKLEIDGKTGRATSVKPLNQCQNSFPGALLAEETNFRNGSPYLARVF